MTNIATLRARRRGFATLTAASTVLALGLTATPAAADEPDEERRGASGEYTHNVESGHQVSMDGTTIGTTIFGLTLHDGTVLSTYCIDFETPIRSNAKYIEDDWANYPGKGDFTEPGKVHWILQNSYPQVDVDSLAENTGVEGLTADDALAATQAAIWHFSNGKNLDEGSATEQVDALYHHLIENAEDLPQSEEPEPSLAFDPAEAEGLAGEIVGEFSVATNAGTVDLVLDGPEGLEIVDMEGNPLDSVGDGDVFGVQVPEGAEPGEATVSGAASASVEVGRLFKGKKKFKETQTLITAEGESTEVEAAVQVSWGEGGDDEVPPPDDDETEPPADDDENEGDDADEGKTPPAQEEDDDADEGGLPVTGGALVGLVIAAIVALGGGGAALYLTRKRRSALPTAEV
jgi:TQXA domain-containing protein